MIAFRNNDPGRYLFALIALEIPFAIASGTLQTWSVASQALPAIGSGPYIPV